MAKYHPLFGIVLVFAVIGLTRLVGGFERAELAAYDLGMSVRASAAPDGRFLLIDESEDDLQRFGHPLPDAILARIIEKLAMLGPSVVGIDKFRDISVPPGGDDLTAALKAHANVFWIYQFGGPGMHRIEPPAPLLDSERIGFNDMVADTGGVVRRGLLYLDDGSAPQASFPLVLALAYLRKAGIQPVPDADDPSVMKLGHSSIRPFASNDGSYVLADAAGYQILLDFMSGPARFPHVTLGELLDDRVSQELVRDRIVILGASAESLKDFFITPFSGHDARTMFGSELHAHATSQLIRLALGEPAGVTTLPDWVDYSLLALCCLAALPAWLRPTASRLLLQVVIGSGGLILVWYRLATSTIWFPIVPMLAGFLLTTAILAAMRAIREARERAALMSIFSRHVSPEVARELWERRTEFLDGYNLRPRLLSATVLFADIRGYSTIAETLEPLQTALWLNQVMSLLAETIMQYKGVIRQYAGDAVMAVYGAPIPSITPAAQAQDACNAVICAQQIRTRLADLNNSLHSQGAPDARLRIGIHTGSMVTCSIGSSERGEYAVVGDAVNVAARLQTLPLNETGMDSECRILISRETWSLLADIVDCDDVGTFEVKGRRDPVGVFRVSDPQRRLE